MINAYDTVLDRLKVTVRGARRSPVTFSEAAREAAALTGETVTAFVSSADCRDAAAAADRHP